MTISISRAQLVCSVVAIGAILATSASAQSTTSASASAAGTSSVCRTSTGKVVKVAHRTAVTGYSKTDSVKSCRRAKTHRVTKASTSGGEVALRSSTRRGESDVRIPVSKERAPEPAPVAAAPEPAPVVAAAPPPPPIVEAAPTPPAPAPEPAPEPPKVKHYGNGFYIGIGAGAGIPIETISEGYNSGLTVAVPIGWDSQTGPFGVRANLGYTRLDSRSTFRNTGSVSGAGFGNSGASSIASGDPQIWSGMADLKLRFPFSGHYDGANSGLYVVGGGGVNHFRNYNTTFALTNPEFSNGSSVKSTSESMTRFALNAGGGLTWGLGMTEVFLESRYVTTFTEGRRASFVPITLGLTFR